MRLGPVGGHLIDLEVPKMAPSKKVAFKNRRPGFRLRTSAIQEKPPMVQIGHIFFIGYLCSPALWLSIALIFK